MIQSSLKRLSDDEKKKTNEIGVNTEEGQNSPIYDLVDLKDDDFSSIQSDLQSELLKLRQESVQSARSKEETQNVLEQFQKQYNDANDIQDKPLLSDMIKEQSAKVDNLRFSETQISTKIKGLEEVLKKIPTRKGQQQNDSKNVEEFLKRNYPILLEKVQLENDFIRWNVNQNKIDQPQKEVALSSEYEIDSIIELKFVRLVYPNKIQSYDRKKKSKEELKVEKENMTEKEKRAVRRQLQDTREKRLKGARILDFNAAYPDFVGN